MAKKGRFSGVWLISDGCSVSLPELLYAYMLTFIDPAAYYAQFDGLPILTAYNAKLDGFPYLPYLHPAASCPRIEPRDCSP